MNVLWIIFWSVVNHVYVCTHVSECICLSSPVGHVAGLMDFLYKERVVSAQCYTGSSCEVSASGIMSVFCLPKILSVLMIEMSTKCSVSIKPFSKHFLINNLFNAFSVHIEVLFSSVAQSCPTPCDPMDCSAPGLPVHHQLPEFTQTHVHWVGDAIQPSHPLWSPSPPAFNLSQHQGLFKWVSSSHQVVKVLEFQLQHQSFQRTLRTDFL